MKNKSTSGNKAASPETQSSSPSKSLTSSTRAPVTDAESQQLDFPGLSADGGKYLPMSEIAAHMGISPRSVQKRMLEGLPHHRFGRSVRFLKSEVDEYLKTVTLKVDTSRKKIDPREGATQQVIPLGKGDPQIKVIRPQSPAKKNNQ